MEIVIILIPLAMIILAIAIGAFFWAVRNDQFDDLDSPAWRVIFDDQEQRKDQDRHPSREQIKAQRGEQAPGPGALQKTGSASDPESTDE